MVRFVFLFFLIGFVGHAQVQFSSKQVDLGTIAEAYEIRGDVILKNTSPKKVFLLRADADKGVKIYTSKKTLLPDDTCLLVISFLPATNGRFNKKINIVSSDRETPYEIGLSGNLTRLKNDDKTACYYFGSRKNSSVPVKEMPVVKNDPTEKRDNSNRMPDQSSTPVNTLTTPVKKEEMKKEINAAELSDSYKPNNILFLVDVSGSMKDSLKLPLMKSALHALIEAVRAIDHITFVTYADSIKVIKEGVNGSEKKMLHDLVDALRAKGLTKGNKAILFSQQLAQKHFIVGGNNQVFLATDGKFRFYSDDFKTWIKNQEDKKIILSTVAFGNDREAMKNLKEIASQCEGSFIHIKKRNGSEDKLLEEIKERSKIQ